ncbi:DUF6069 family protein [Actinocatenispora rupis]|uniref:Uncharacterized protein n=1 Tax=Actinocatenispora rupis TaxID=519421 RepID=A0A8J3JH33_9ACTN|nr:DUF6069 family protein [Actinocatenispora rupis]GID16272.1 hypothetical protein Aru02nite_71610 [Actinocatenispora rupis]
MTWYGSAQPQRPEDRTTKMPAYGPEQPGEYVPASGPPGAYAPGGTPRTDRPRVNGSRLWTGGAVAAVIAAGVAVVAFLIVRGLLNLPMLGVKPGGAVFQGTAIGYALAAAVAAILATGVMHLLLIGTPRPFFYFGWIGGLCTAIVTLAPLLTTQSWEAKGATAVANLVIGIAITALVSGTARTAIERPGQRPVA